VSRRVSLAVALLAVLGTAGPSLAASTHAGPSPTGRTCTWGGTAAAPTGTFTITPGLTNVPAARPMAFRATGELAGGAGCHGTMTWVGQIDAGSTCVLAFFEGRVKGLPGVANFVGRGNVDVPSTLYDKAGNVVGEENAEVLTPPNAQSHLTDCTQPGGFTGGWPGTFASVLHVFT
jgi:hypothetical protein